MFAMTAAALNSLAVPRLAERGLVVPRLAVPRLAVPRLALTVYLALACHCEGEKFAQRIFLPAAISCFSGYILW